MKRWLASGLGLLLGVAAPYAVAQPPSWGRSDRVQLGSPVSAAPAATLGLPIADEEPGAEPVQKVAYQLESESPAATVFRMQVADDAPPPFRPPDPGPAPRPATSSGSAHTSRFGEVFTDAGIDGHLLGKRNAWFESDHCFDCFISPITNPLLFEDPRAVTEVRPIFFVQSIPRSNPLFQGGNAEFYGIQARVAITDRLSFVMHELGGVTINPGTASGLPSQSGFAELHLGPKFTFLHSVDNQFVGAAGLMFQLPVGPARVFQDTGSFSMTPYVSLAKNLFPTSIGSFNVMDTFGYTIRTDGTRSDYFYNSIHLDWDVGNRHRLYPLVELNWFHYTRSGSERTLGFEGLDFANFRVNERGRQQRPQHRRGWRYKFSEHLQFGGAVEFPLNKGSDIQQLHSRST